MGRLGIELGALSAPEIRRLLEVARTRGQDSLVEQLTAELNGRTATWRPPSIAAAQAWRSVPPPMRAGGVGRSRFAAVLSGLVAAGLAWGLTVPLASDQRAQAHADTPPAARMAVALAQEVVAESSDAPVETDTGPETTRAAPVRLARAEPRPVRNRCLNEPTPAERLVCGYPALADQHRRMLAAYESARAAGADPLVLDSAQAAWRARSANVADRRLLDDLYEDRIRELRADAAALQRDEPPF